MKQTEGTRIKRISPRRADHPYNLCIRIDRDSERHMEPSRDAVEEADLVTVARFRSHAEAGFFADQLESVASIRAVLTSVDDFNAIAGHWGEVIHLRVAPQDSKRAAAALRDLLAESSSEGQDAVAAPQTVSLGESAAAANWLPMVLAFAAGSVSLYAIQTLDRAAAPAQEQAVAAGPLLKKLAESRRPWVQALPGGGRRELRAESLKEFVLREDRDADGRFERSRSFATSDAPEF
jgi:hypothetical protein